MYTRQIYNHMIFIPDVDHYKRDQYRCEVSNAHRNDVIVFHVHGIVLENIKLNDSSRGVILCFGGKPEYPAETPPVLNGDHPPNSRGARNGD
ncbi:hypothetical protein DPMN_150112 [Dreissena polymorpha]|uniref:Uncharacterized protein n=1 Tax=Dreissena polymorpha TaxID=45954 RepID=A0A9D4FFS2_DREPO|nr:hypothetical protein DPMN_150112 [Dreissena polymorpha]